MKNVLPAVLSVVIFCCFAYSCIDKNGDDNYYSYDEMYKDSFDILLSRGLHNPPALDDSLYAEMYIALKTCGDENHFSMETAEIVIDRADKLMELDDVPENQRKYLEAKQIVLMMMKDYKSAIHLDYQIYNTYPQNSLERLMSLGQYFLVVQNPDSAEYYLDRTLEIAKEEIYSDDENKAKLAILCSINALIFQHRDDEAKELVDNIIETSDDFKLVNMLEKNGFYGLKDFYWNTVNEMQNYYNQ